jgi:uncharacterized protein (DUF1697 family)
VADATTWVALLRGVNVGGRKMVAMADLRDVLTALGFAGARTVLQSGNLVFRARARAGAALERQLETEIRQRLMLETAVVVRSGEEVRRVIARNPFRAQADRTPGTLLVAFLKVPPRAAALDALRAAITGPETVQAHGRELYVVYPNGVGRSRLTHALIEAKLGVRATARNWNTVRRLAALADG